MIVGNRNAGKKILTAMVAVLLVMLLMTVVVASRRKSEPLRNPPLHPTVLLWNGWR